MSAKVGEREHVVGIEDAHHFHRIEVQALGDHLRTHKDVGFMVLKSLQNALVVVFRAGGVEVKAGNLSFRHNETQVLLNLLSTEAMHPNVGAVTYGTLRRHRSRVTTIMATQHVLALVINQTHVAVDALRHIVTLVALQTQREAASILEQDGLVMLFQSFLHRVD